MEILASRMLLRPADYQQSLTFYRDRIGLAIAREYSGGTVFSRGSRCWNWPVTAPRTTWRPVSRRAVAAGPRPRGHPGRAARARVAIAREARQEPWGLHEMHVVDPDGITLIFIQIPADHPLRRDTRGERQAKPG